LHFFDGKCYCGDWGCSVPIPLIQKETCYYPFICDPPECKDKFKDNKEKEFRMTDLDLIIIVFLQLINYNKIAMYPEEIASYLGCSKKAFYCIIRKLERIKGKVSTN
jgi:hypothetical protein